jgi:hypothetical protein
MDGFDYYEIAEAADACFGCGARTPAAIASDAGEVVAWICPTCAADDAVLNEMHQAIMQAAASNPLARRYEQAAIVLGLERLEREWEAAVGEPIRSTEQLLALAQAKHVLAHLKEGRGDE